ncbi:proteasome-activating nucleotidase [Candidatus Woesearchaeota archaeon]|jgi:proteasome regulatory subunit|nr:proteasome-activating nucleotidase [Candidatus Woesearchaeota archaeon]|tara:strand:- start:5812 stop:6945 length:1134 start_codon:yes stop_codon:yes gene_type:complete
MDSEKLGDVVYGYTASSNALEEQNTLLKENVDKLRNELDRYKKAPLMICEIREVYANKAVIKIPNGNQFLVEISSDCERLRAGDSVLVEQKNLVVIEKLAIQNNFEVEKFVIIDNPDVPWKQVGGLKKQIDEIREVVELPIKKPEMFRKAGIQPPKGILLHGEPGTGKTLLAKAVATSTNATFIEIVGSELVQKYIGEGAKLVKDIFQLARERAPSIVFIDELDALAAKRIDLGTSGEREVQRTFMQFLAEIDGFENLAGVKIIGCTNRKDMLDSAVVRPGRLERHIHIPVPTKEARKEIFKIHIKNMNLKDVDVQKVLSFMEDFTGADVRAVCTEAGYCAIRQSRTIIKTEDFMQAIIKLKEKEQQESEEHLQMFG